MIGPSALPNLSVLGVTAVEACTAMSWWQSYQSLGLGIAISTVAGLVGGLHCYSFHGGPDLLD